MHDTHLDELPLTIAALAASADGLHALREFFTHIPANPNIAYVVITPVCADASPPLALLLENVVAMPIKTASTGDAIQGGHLYVSPPGHFMRIQNGTLMLGPQSPEPPHPRPIDQFMTALADDCPERCIGIILHGADHDGTLGLTAIKAAGGMTLVAPPHSTTWPDRANHGIHEGLADRVLSPAAMPAAITHFLNHRPHIDPQPHLADGALGLEPVTDRLNEVLTLVLERTGQDFRWYRPAMLRRRLRRRMALKNLDRVSDYLTVLDESRDEINALKSEFLIGVTEFFRDPEAWQELNDSVLPALLAERQNNDSPIRVWTPGCATGEESYSIAMLLMEHCQSLNKSLRIQVFGTDIDPESLKVARSGAYPERIAKTVSEDRLTRFFERHGDRYVVTKALRDAVVFAPHNLVQDTPFSKLDLILCRNVLIYFETDLQERVLEIFHFALKPQGYLLLGKAESLGAHTGLFEPISRSARLFRRLGVRPYLRGAFSGGWSAATMGIAQFKGPAARPQTAGELLISHLAGRSVTAAVLIDREGRALHFRGDTAQFLEPQGDASLELLRMARHRVRTGLRAVLRQALAHGQTAQHTSRYRSGATLCQVHITAEPITALEGTGLVVVWFIAAPHTCDSLNDADDDATSLNHTLDLEQEIDESRRELALALEDAERSNEDLRIANEETLALNEELQSSNEELESSKEELQSLNEELATVNAQLEDKISEVTRSADDLTNLLESTQVATILLDPARRIRRFTPAASTIFSVQAGDEGRLLSDIASRINDPDFTRDLEHVLETAHTKTAEVRSGTGAYLLRRIQPYLTQQGKTDGVVITFVDITPLRTAEQQLEHLLGVLHHSNDAVLVYEPQGRILSWNAGAMQLYGYSAEEALTSHLFKFIPERSQASARALIERAINAGPLGPEDTERVHRDGRIIRVSVTVSSLLDDRGQVYALLSTERDLTERLQRESELYFRRLADRIPALLRVEDGAGRTQFLNQACLDFTQRHLNALLGQGWLEFVHPDDRSRYMHDHARHTQTQSRFEADLRLRHGQGQYRWMRSISVPHFDNQNAFAGYLVLAVDVDEHKRAEAELAAADQRKDEYLAMLAHELRNPLAPIRNAVFMLACHPHPDPKTLWASGIISRQTEVLAKLLDDLLDVARISRGNIHLERTPIDLAVPIERALEISRPLLDAAALNVRVNTPPDAILVEGDLLRLTQIFANLLNNAAKYTNPHGWVEINLSQEVSKAVVTVRDNGEGMSADILPRIFEPFAQADRTLDRCKGGLGLGLTLAQKLALLHHGSISAYSAGTGQGSTFTVSLPLLPNPQPSPVSQPIPAAPRTPHARRILLVDDRADAAESLGFVLRAHNHEVWLAYNAQEALTLAEQVQPEIAILDIGLPGTDGYQIARILRGRAHSAKATLIALTGYGQLEDATRARQAGFDYHLVKPAHPGTLLTLIAQAPRLHGGDHETDRSF